MDTEFATRQMVRQQIRAWDVFDPDVLAVFATVPRQQFVPSSYRDLAFADTEIPLPNGQYMMSPTIEGRLLQSLSLSRSDEVLEVGTGSGFLTACLSKLSASVFSMEIYDSFVSTAHNKLAAAGVDNVKLDCADACTALPAGEFDAIAITGSLPVLDDRFIAKLRPGGRLFAVVGSGVVQEARLIRRSSDTDWESTTLFETSLMPLINCIRPLTFVF